MQSEKWIKRIFYLICGLTAAGMSTYWFNEYRLDGDISSINYKQIKELESNAVPILSLCFNLEDMVTLSIALERKGEWKNVQSTNAGNLYLDFLRGKFSDQQSYDKWINTPRPLKNRRNVNTRPRDFGFNKLYNNSKWMSIDFDNVTLQLADYVKYYELNWQNGSLTKHTSFDTNLLRYPEMSYAGTVLWTDDFVKCFQIQLGDTKIVSLTIGLNRKVFPGSDNPGLQTAMRPDSRGFFILMHIPNQVLLSRTTLMHKWPKFSFNNFGFDSWFSIESIEILKRRYKTKQPCMHNWKNYDTIEMEKHVTNIGCRTPFQKLSKYMPICSSMELMKEAHQSISLEHFNDLNHPRPCKSMENIDYRHEDYESRDFHTGIVRFWPVKSTHYFKEIEQTRAIPFLDLVGNVGGFIGIFVGHSVLQLLQAVLGWINNLERKFSKYKEAT